MTFRNLLFAGVGAGLAIAAAPAFAQDDTTVEELTIQGQRLSEQRSIDAKKKAAGVVDVIAADEIGNLPDKNAAENLERLPGVSLKYDQGEGRYVTIRGVDGSLNNVTVNGSEIGSPDSDTRQAPLDVVSGQLTSRIEVIKAVTPDMDGQAIGGTVNLVTQSPFDLGADRLIAFTAQAGQQDLNNKVPYGGELSVGGLFGPDKSFGLLAGATYSIRDYRTYGVYPDDWRDVAGVPRGMPTNIKYTTYDLERERIGFTGALEWRPTDGDKLYLRGLFSQFNEDEYRQRYRLDFATAAMFTAGRVTVNADGRTGVSTNAERRQDLRLEKKDKSIATLALGGEHERGDWTFWWDLSRGQTKLDEPNGVWQFRGGSLTVDWDMGPLLYTATPRVEATPSALGFRQVAFQDNTGEEGINALKLDARRELWTDSYIKFGVKLRDTDKTQDTNNDVYLRAATAANRFTLADFGLQGADTRTRLDGRTYFNSPTIDAATMVAFTRDNLDGPRFLLDASTSLSNAVLGDYEVEEQVGAAYGMADLAFGPWSVLAGLRAEHTATDVTGNRLTNGATVTRVSSASDYWNLLFDLHVRYRPTENLVFRAAFTQTIGRPQYPQLSPGGGLSYLEVTPGVFEGSFSEGNADLKPYSANNLDLTSEWYFAPGGLLSAGVFHKEISDPIFGYSETRNNVTLEGRTFSILEYSQPRNADRGRITGVELAWRQQFGFLPGALSGLGVSANATFTDSQLEVPGRAEDLPFPKQSDKIYGFQIFYQKYGFEASLNYHYASAYQDSLGDDAASDTFFNSYERVDLKAAYRISRNVSVFIEGQNLNDEVLWEYQGGRADRFIGYERYGATWYAGLTARW